MSNNHNQNNINSLSQRDKELIRNLNKAFDYVKSDGRQKSIALTFGISEEDVQQVLRDATKEAIAKETHRMVFDSYEDFSDMWETIPRDRYGVPANFSYEASFSGRVLTDGDTRTHLVSNKIISKYGGSKGSENWKGSTTIGMRIFFDDKWHHVVDGELAVTRTPKESFLRRMGRI